MRSCWIGMILMLALTGVWATQRNYTSTSSPSRRVQPDAEAVEKVNRFPPLRLRKAYAPHREPHPRVVKPLRGVAGDGPRPRRSFLWQPRALIGEPATPRRIIWEAYLRDCQAPPTLTPNHLALIRTEHLVWAMTRWFEPRWLHAPGPARLLRWSREPVPPHRKIAR